MAIIVLLAILLAATVEGQGSLGFFTETSDCDAKVNLFKAHDYCNMYYVCNHNAFIERFCPFATVWNQYCPLEGRCDIATEEQLVYCRDKINFILPGTRDPDRYMNWTGQAPRNVNNVRQNPVCSFVCANGQETLPPYAECDGSVQCSDGSDEYPLCARPNCNEDNCRLEDGCLCASTDPPAGLSPSMIPQMVMIGFEGGLREIDNRWLFDYIFETKEADGARTPRLNNNGCPWVGTFFPTHLFNNYAVMRNLYSKGHEFASLSITQRLDNSWWAFASQEQLKAEIADHRQIMELLAGIAPHNVRGARAPYIEVSNNYYQMLLDNDFTWDSSLPSRSLKHPLWPYTLNFKSPQNDECVVKGCPTKSFPNLWEVPLIDAIDLNGRICGNEIGYCPHYSSEQLEYQFLKNNFDRHYFDRRAPFPLLIQGHWLDTAASLNRGAPFKALIRFLDELETDYDDVYVVTFSQVIEWMKNPTPIRDINNFQPWLWCDPQSNSYEERPPPCSDDTTIECEYSVYVPYRSTVEFNTTVTTCAIDECPPEYPLPGNVEGLSLN